MSKRVWDRSYMHTPEFREAVSKGVLKHYALHPMTVETKQKISRSNTGKPRPPEWCQHISEAKKGSELKNTDALVNRIKAFVGVM